MSWCHCYGTFRLHDAFLMQDKEQSNFCRGDFRHHRHDGNRTHGYLMQGYPMGRLGA